jgi:hypothetical protein
MLGQLRGIMSHRTQYMQLLTILLRLFSVTTDTNVTQENEADP